MAIDSVTGLTQQVKRVAEFIPLTFVFTTLANGETITGVNSVSQINLGNIPGSANAVVNNFDHDNAARGQLWIAGGTDGEDYCLSMLVSTSTGAVRSCSGVVKVREAC